MSSQFVTVMAYIDPGLGSIILQVVIAGMLSAGIMFRRYLIAPLKALFRGSRRTEDGSGETRA